MTFRWFTWLDAIRPKPKSNPTPAFTTDVPSMMDAYVTSYSQLLDHAYGNQIKALSADNKHLREQLAWVAANAGQPGIKWRLDPKFWEIVDEHRGDE